MPEKPSAEWYKTAFSELYQLIYAHRDDQAASAEMTSLIRRLNLVDSGASTLDLCCGDGRHGATLCELGLDVFGIDLSPQLLERAARRPRLAQRLVRGDMRSLPFPGRFDLILNLFTSFGYFEDETENLSALGEMARVLTPGARLVIDHINRSWVERTLISEDETAETDFLIRQRRSIVADRVRKEITIEWRDGRTLALTEDVRMYRPEEMRELMSAVGLAKIEFWGAYDGEPFREQSRRMIVTAVKPE